MKKWLPLESNPEVLNEFVEKLGLDTSQHQFHDVFGLDDELLAMVPQPVLAVMLLFPVTKKSDALAKEADASLASRTVIPEVFYMKQTIGNACGTIAVLHGVGNNLDKLKIGPESFFEKFFAATKGLSAAERGKYLEEPPQGGPSLEDAHQSAANEGATAPPPADEDVDLHFIAFVNKDGHLFELDGRRAGPVDHGPSEPQQLLKDAAGVVRQFMDRTNSLQFNVIALAAAG